MSTTLLLLLLMSGGLGGLPSGTGSGSGGFDMSNPLIWLLLLK